MSDHLVADGAFVNSIVGEGTKFTGELELNGLLRIDGDFSGVIKTPGKVLVGKNGRAQCSIEAGTVVIGGIIKGDITTSEKVIILSTAMVIGTIVTPRLIVEDGVIFNGECLVQKEAATLKKAEGSGLSADRKASPSSESKTPRHDSGQQREPQQTVSPSDLESSPSFLQDTEQLGFQKGEERLPAGKK